MIQQCRHCGSFDIQAGLDLVQCLTCGQHTTYTNQKVAPSSAAKTEEN